MVEGLPDGLACVTELSGGPPRRVEERRIKPPRRHATAAANGTSTCVKGPCHSKGERLPLPFDVHLCQFD